MKDIFAKCEAFLEGPRFLQGTHRDMAAELFSAVSPSVNAGPWMQSNGRPVLQFSSNDYLGLAMHPDVGAVATRCVADYGICSPMGSRLLTGSTDSHLQLERQIADFKGREAALVFSAGSLAMIGAMACLARPGDLVVMDQYAHATLVCGAKSSGANIVFFRHNDLDHLEEILRRSDDGQPTAIVVDGIYSMQGDMAPLAELVRLKRRYGARLVVDDAHGTGVFGRQGRGTADHLGVAGQVDLELGTFSKAVGTAGGFLAADRSVVDYVRYHAPTFVFTKAMPMAVAEATAKALSLLEDADDHRDQLWQNTRRLQERLLGAGFNVGATQSPITPIEMSGNDALYFAHGLRKRYGIWVAPVVYPAVPLGASILRVIPTAMHTDEDIDSLLYGLCQIRASVALGAMTPT